MKIDTSWYSSSKTTFMISSVEQLLGFGAIVNATDGSVIPFDDFTNKTVNLNTDIDLSAVGDEWCPVGNVQQVFNGTFNGNGRTIRGLQITSGIDFMGLFGATGEDAFINDLTLVADIKGGSQVGGIVAVNGGQLRNCKFMGSISGAVAVGGITGVNTGILKRCCNKGNISSISKYTGGIVGLNQSDIGEVTDCYNIGAITGVNCVGGIAGHNSGTLIKNCFNTGLIQCSKSSSSEKVECMGGIVGYNNAGCPITNCYSTACIIGEKSVGGIAGQNYGSVNNCVNKGQIKGFEYTGGIVGTNDNGELKTCNNRGNIFGKQCIGGVVGNNKSGNIENCANSSVVNSELSMCGGVVGFSKWGRIVSSSNDGDISTGECCGGVVGQIKYGKAIDCINTGTVNGTSTVGGVAGCCVSRGMIISCYNVGQISGTKVIGGLVGNAFGDIRDSFNAGNVCGIEDFSSIVGVADGGAIQDCYSTGKLINKSVE